MGKTCYVLEDGRTVDPDEVAPDADGVLRHSSGVAVAYGQHGPRSRAVYHTSEAVPERPRRGYKTRGPEGAPK